MKRLWTILTVALLAAALTAPAAAAKGKPAPRTSYFDVTMEFVGTAEGLSTTGGACGEARLAVLESEDAGRSLHSFAGVGGVPMIELRLGPALAWYRDYPYFADPAAAYAADLDPADYPYAPRLLGSGLTGCHGAGLDVYVEYADALKVLTDDRIAIVQYPGWLQLTLADGEVGFLWHSDYYREWEKRVRKSWGATVIEDFTYSSSPSPGGVWAWEDEGGNPVVWDPAVGATGIVTGWLRWTHFSPGIYDDNGNEPRPITFRLTVMPAG